MALMKIYLVEDSALIRENLIATLEELLPVQVVGWAADEATALRWLDTPGNDAALVIVDLFLQAGSGLGVLKAVGRGAPTRQWVMLSNYAHPAVRGRCLELGAARVFDKSSDIEALVSYCATLAAHPGVPVPLAH
jgi:DNA-binding NarL/FixJ family response regulator